MKNKMMLFKVSIVLVLWVVISYIHTVISPMVVADSAVLQLQDSDSAYAEFKGVQRIVNNFWILYLVPLTLFIPNIIKAFKEEK